MSKKLNIVDGLRVTHCEGKCPVCGTEERTVITSMLAEKAESIVYKCACCSQEYTELFIGIDDEAVDFGELGEYANTTYFAEED